MAFPKILLLTIFTCCVHYALCEDSNKKNDKINQDWDNLLRKFDDTKKDNNISPDELKQIVELEELLK